MGSVRRAAEKAGDHPVLARGARLGYAASGLLHLLLAWVALQVAWSRSAGSADQEGALRTIAGTAPGSALLWLALAGFALLAAWQVTEAIARRDTTTRLRAVGRAVVHLALAWTVLQVVQGGGAGDEQSTTTATLLRSTGGRLLVATIGLGVLGVAGHHVVKGWRRTFLEDLRADPGRWTVRAGSTGYVAKGVALAVVAVLLLGAALRSDPAEAGGLDDALRSIVELPFGPVLLTLVALGFAAYGIYSFVRARLARV